MISIIIPSYEFHELIQSEVRGLIKYLESIKLPFEIILVDDGSKNQEIPKAHCKELNIKFLSNQVNLGKGASIAKGMKAAKGDFLIYTDADIPFKYKNIIDIVKNLEEGYQVVIGDRNLTNSKYHEQVGLLRSIFSKVYTVIIKVFISSFYSDTQCGLKGFQRETGKDLFRRLRTNGFAFDVELIKRSLDLKYKINKIPVEIRKVNEKSTVSLIKHVPEMLWDTLQIIIQS